MVANLDYVLRSWCRGTLTIGEAAELMHMSIIRFLNTADARIQEMNNPPIPVEGIDMARIGKDEIIRHVSVGDIGANEAAFALSVSEEEVQRLVDEWMERHEKNIEKEWELWQNESCCNNNQYTESCCPVCKAPMKRVHRDDAIYLLCEECGHTEVFIENLRRTQG